MNAQIKYSIIAHWAIFGNYLILFISLYIDLPFLDGDVPRSTSYGVHISQLIQLARMASHVDDFNTRNKF